MLSKLWLPNENARTSKYEAEQKKKIKQKTSPIQSTSKTIDAIGLRERQRRSIKK